MKKLFITLCILALCSPVLAGGITEKLKAVVARQTVAGGDCPALSGDLWQEDFSGDGMPVGWVEDEDVVDADYNVTTNPPLTNYCFADQMFKLDNDADFWTKTDQIAAKTMVYLEVDIYISASALTDGQYARVLHLWYDSGVKSVFFLENASGTLYLVASLTGTDRGDPVEVEVGGYYRIGMMTNNDGVPDGAWIVYSYGSSTNLGTWAGAVGVADTDQGFIGTYGGAAATIYYDNFEGSSTGWMQLSP